MDMSLIISTFNRRALLLSLLREIGGQAAPGLEVIVADDGSTDDTVATVRNMGADLPFGLQAVTQEKRGFRVARSRNRGARLAGGAQLVFMDDDCRPSSTFIASYAAAFRPDHLLRGDIVFVRSTDRLDDVIEVKPGTDDLWGANFSLPAGLFWRVGGFDEDFVDEAGEDTDLYLRLMRLGVGEARVEGAHVYHLGNHHAGGLSRNLFWDVKVHDPTIRRNTNGGRRL